MTNKELKAMSEIGIEHIEITLKNGQKKQIDSTPYYLCMTSEGCAMSKMSNISNGDLCNIVHNLLQHLKHKGVPEPLLFSLASKALCEEG